MGIVKSEDHRSLELRVKAIEERFGNMTYDMRGVVQSELKDRMVVHQQSESQFGLYTALCVETIDIWKQNRIRFFCPAFHNPRRPIKELPWAYPVSSMGGFDDCGLSWVPPAGSTVCILFEAGQRSSPFYIGTTWHRDRGASGQHNWGYNIDEYYKIHEGHRKGYLVGPNDESQVLPPWNTESYNGFDLSSIVDFAANPEAQRRITYPNIYGFKTPEKHMFKMVDGDPKCNRRWKRLEIMSSCGNWMMMKDDHLHYAGQWSHPDCGVEDGDVSCIEGQSEGSAFEDITRFQGLSANSFLDANTNDTTPKEGQKKEDDVGCEGKIIGGHPATGHPKSAHYQSQKGANPYFKHQNECRPYKGPGTPQNNKCDLPQTGIQIMSISGHTLVMDDSVEEPSGAPEWERSTKDFEFGCNDHYAGRLYLRSATGHSIEMSDVESPSGDLGSKLRGEDNYIRLMTANGIKIEMNDHTVAQKDCPGCPPNVGGSKRGIFMGSTSGHTFEMNDQTVEQCSPCRKENGYAPKRKAKQAFVKIRTGYGLEFLMKDEASQEETIQQHIQLFCPQRDNLRRGPHIHRYQESAKGPGLVFLRSGGNYVIMTYDNKVEVIGDVKKNPADKTEIISRKKLVYTKDQYINVTEKTHTFIAKQKIMLLAGEDCQPKDGGKCGPCAGPVLVYVNGCVRLSDRLIGSASSEATPASLFMFTPLIKSPPPQNACKGVKT